MRVEQIVAQLLRDGRDARRPGAQAVTAFTNVRALRALNMRRRGLRLDDIAGEMAVTRERARQLAALGLEIERRAASTDPWDKLSARVRNALTRDESEPTADGVVEP